MDASPPPSTSQGAVGVLGETFRRASSILVLLLVLLQLATVAMAAAIYFCESGVWASIQSWMRIGNNGLPITSFNCTVPCPSLADIDSRQPYDLDVPYQGCWDGSVRQSSVSVLLPYILGNVTNCEELRFQSPLNSIPSAMYFVMTTLTTVGYGDIVPLTGGGKALAALTMFLGLLTISLPVAVIAGEFDKLFKAFEHYFSHRVNIELLGIKFDFRSIAKETRASDALHERREKLITVLCRAEDKDIEGASSGESRTDYFFGCLAPSRRLRISPLSLQTRRTTRKPCTADSTTAWQSLGRGGRSRTRSSSSRRAWRPASATTWLYLCDSILEEKC